MDPGMINPTAYDYSYRPPTSTSKIIIVSSIAAGIQFGWALQLSLLTPYIQLLGVPHLWAAIIWLCGPVSGLLVQPIVGYHSDKCTSPWGRRRPFIAAGTVLVSLSVFLIGFAADLGVKAGDSLDQKTKPRAVFIFVIGFWILDVANNMLQGPCRALLADLSDDNHKKMRTANSYYSFFMAVGNVLGYGAGSYKDMYQFLPFTETVACDVYCANLKTCFIISICLLIFLTALALIYVSEIPISSTDLQNNAFSDDEYEEAEEDNTPFFCQMIEAIKGISRPMKILLAVTSFNWVAWFPFLLYDTDWMGTEVYGGNVHGNAKEIRLYDKGVRAGSLGLLINSVVLAFASLGIEPSSRFCGSVKNLWGIVNLILAVCLAGTVFVTKFADQWRIGQPALTAPPFEVKASALSIFAILGIPQAATYTIPFALASIFSTTSGFGQGFSMGLLNISIVLPQMLVSLVSGYIDSLFGGGNLPSFVMGAIAAAISSFLAFFVLPSPQAQALPTKKAGEHWTDT